MLTARFLAKKRTAIQPRSIFDRVPLNSFPMQLCDIQIRDPFVLPAPSLGEYFLFGTTDKNPWSGPGWDATLTIVST
jgi:hypothetical protein